MNELAIQTSIYNRSLQQPRRILLLRAFVPMCVRTQRKEAARKYPIYSPSPAELSFPLVRSSSCEKRRGSTLQTNLIDRAALTYPNKQQRQKRVRRTTTTASAG